MKVIIAVLAGSFLSVVTNLVSNFLAPEADRHKTLVLRFINSAMVFGLDGLLK